LKKRGLAFFLICLSIVISRPVAGQDTVITSPFTQGRTLVLVGGNISSSSVNKGGAFSGFKYISNDYLLGMSALKLVKNRLGLGGQFYTGRTENTELVKLQTELLYFGPWVRLYWNSSRTGSLYPQMSLYYVNYFSNRESENQGIPYNESLTGKGFGTSLGIGYSYVVNNHVNLEVGMIYQLFYLFGNLHNELVQTDENVNFMRTQIMFSLAFGVLFDKKVNLK
jgi:hypothetical protein